MRGQKDTRAEDFFVSKASLIKKAEEMILKKQVEQIRVSNLTTVDKEEIAEGDLVFLDREVLPRDREMLGRSDKLRHK